MEKFLTLFFREHGKGDAYSSENTHTGEKCYMVDRALYRDILLAVAARKQNEQSLAAAADKLEQHMEQIEHRVIQGEKDALEQMTSRMNRTFEEMRDDQHTRMKNVMADIRALSDSMKSSAEHGMSSSEMQRLRFQNDRYEQVFPLCQVQIKDLKEQNQKLRTDLLAEKYRNEQLKIRLDKAEALVITMGTSTR